MRWPFIFSLGMIMMGSGCNEDEPRCNFGQNIECGTNPWNESVFILPYPRGTKYRVNQGNNNTCGGHVGAYKYGYDFDMPVGSVVIASLGGVVTEVRSDNPDGINLTLGNENLVKIRHDDGTTMGYSHLKQSGITVLLGQQVQQGDTIGLSGNSGYTDNFPHLHFHLSSCDEPTDASCSTLLVKFKNTRENECGLIQNEYYEALY